MRAELVYLDSSALVKLVVRERESGALRDYLAGRPQRASCALARVEIMRAVLPHGGAATTRAQRLLARLDLVRLDDALLDAAALLGSDGLRSLDAIHIAAARAFAERLEALVTYDERMAGAARGLGVLVATPR